MADNALDWVKGNHGLATECYRAVPAKTCNIDGEDYPCRTIRAIAALEAENERLKALLREWVEINDSPCDVDERTQHCYGHAVLTCHPVPCLVARTRAALGKQQEGRS